MLDELEENCLEMVDNLSVASLEVARNPKGDVNDGQAANFEAIRTVVIDVALRTSCTEGVGTLCILTIPKRQSLAV
jgi:hypothetical protein